MISRSASRAVIAALAPLVLVGTATAAHAGTFRHRDATGDVIVGKRFTSGVTRAVDSTQRRPDIQQFTVVHTPDVVSIATTLRGIDGVDDDWRATVVTSKGDRFVVARSVSTGADVPGAYVTASRNGYLFKCNGITATRTASGVIAKLPTNCLGNPWKVRVGVQAKTEYREDGPETWGNDDALLTRGFTDSKPALSPWIAR